MPTVTHSARALADLARLFDVLASTDPATAAHAAQLIIDAVTVLERHPYIGRSVRGRLRKLIVSHGKTGYVALYRVTPQRDRVEVLALRHRREAGYQV